MKIRIKGNTLRLRLAQSEVDEVQMTGRVSDSINFGMKKLIYSLQVVNQPEISATYEGDYIMVNVPEHLADSWLTTDRVGLDAHHQISQGEKLYILIEKDFQCLKPRQGEDESDLFDNPQA